MSLHPNYVTPETEAWFRQLLASVGPLKAVTTHLGVALPTRLGPWLVLNRAEGLFDQRVLHGPPLDGREHVARAVTGLAVSYQLPVSELRYVAHLVATAPAEPLRALHHEITGTNMVHLPAEFTPDYLDQFLAADPDEEAEFGPDHVPARTPRLPRRAKGIPFL